MILFRPLCYLMSNVCIHHLGSSCNIHLIQTRLKWAKVPEQHRAISTPDQCLQTAPICLSRTAAKHIKNLEYLLLPSATLTRSCHFRETSIPSLPFFRHVKISQDTKRCRTSPQHVPISAWSWVKSHKRKAPSAETANA